MPGENFWRQVTPDETRVPEREPLTVETLVPESSSVLRETVEAREEELYFVSSDSKCYGRWCLNGASPFQKKDGVVIVPGHPTLKMEGQLEPQTMNSPLLLTIADECQRAGLATLRFDYRGVGKSKGNFDDVACVRDVVAAVQTVNGPFQNVTLIAFGFGSAQSLGNVYTKGITKFVSLSHGLGLGSTNADGTRRAAVLPSLELLYNRTNIFFSTMRITIPKLWIVGDDDLLTNADDLLSFLRISPGRGELSTIVKVQNTPHDLRNAESAVAKRLLSWIQTSSEITFHLHFASGPVVHKL